MSEKNADLQEAVFKWMLDNDELFLPPPVRFVIRVGCSVERKILSGVITYLDSIITGLMILLLISTLFTASIFISLQVYKESVYVAENVVSITSTLNVTDSYFLDKLNSSMSNSGLDVENVMDSAYQYGEIPLKKCLHFPLHLTI